jgi:transcriptional regulator with XRE-family HTH domain
LTEAVVGVIYIKYMSVSQALGLQIREWRLRRGLTQAALAERAGLSHIFVAKVEGGARAPSWPTLERLARALRVTVRIELVGRH